MTLDFWFEWKGALSEGWHVIDEKGRIQLDTSRIVHSFSRSMPRREIYLRLCRAYPGGMSLEEISAETGYGKETVIGALLGNKGRYKTEDALVTIGLAAISEEEYRGQKVVKFTATSNGEDVDYLFKDYERSVGLLDKLKEYIDKFENKLFNDGREANGKGSNTDRRPDQEVRPKNCGG